MRRLLYISIIANISYLNFSIAKLSADFLEAIKYLINWIKN